MEAALGVAPDLSLVPVDGRVGPFTSNASVSPDPVHPYLLTAEAVAAAVVPSRLAACDGTSPTDIESCLRTELGPALERLFRRPLGSSELVHPAETLSSLRAGGLSAVDATRSILSAALLSPDLLFRSAAGLGSAASARARLVAEHASFALWDAPPDTALVTAVAGSTEADMSIVWRDQAQRLSRDPRATAVVARFLAQWLDVDVDLRRAEPAFETSPRFREWLALVEHALTADLPVTSLIAGRDGFVHESNLAAYGLDSVDGATSSGVVAVTWPEDSPRRGLLGQDLIADSTRHPDAARRVIFRGKLIRSALLCQDIPAPTAELLAMAGEVGDRTTDPRCASCHQFMDPIGTAFSVLDADRTASPGPARVIGGELEGTYPDLPALLDAVATSHAFAECFAEHWLAFFLEQPSTEIDAAWVSELADTVASGATLSELIAETVVSFAARSEITPWCEGS